MLISIISSASWTLQPRRCRTLLQGDKECPLSGVTNSGRVWRKVPESEAWSVPWPQSVDLWEKLWGRVDSLQLPADFAMATSLTIQHGTWNAEEETEGVSS